MKDDVPGTVCCHYEDDNKTLPLVVALRRVTLSRPYVLVITSPPSPPPCRHYTVMLYVFNNRCSTVEYSSRLAFEPMNYARYQG